MTIFGPLGLSFAPQVRRSKTLYRWLKPFSDWYAQVAGYRKMGLKYDDLLIEENDTVQKAIGRLTPREAYDRVYRFRIASHCSVLHRDLPKDQWVKAKEDVRYLVPHVEQVHSEMQEKAKWDNILVTPKKM